jgi:hypothetical protein
MRTDTTIALPVITVIALIMCQGCATVAQFGTAVGEAAGVITSDQAASINRSAEAVGKTFESITPEQEYFIGRAVAATVLVAYKPYDDPDANQYGRDQRLCRAGRVDHDFARYDHADSQ